MLPLTRREFLSSAFLAPTLARLQPLAGGRLVGTVPFGDAELPQTPLNRLLGAGLDARLFTDLTALAPDRLVTPSEHFFVRTATPPTLPDAGSWRIDVAGLVETAPPLSLESLTGLGHASGRYLIECAGNADPNNYGLISVADWEGVPVAAVLDRLRPTTPKHRILVVGFDIENTPQQTSRTSLPGASWIFTRDDLRQALLATRMNGTPLPREHGAPVRLVIPGWYGCACIKWVTRIELVGDEAAPTTQMWEFANRTHQPSDPDDRTEPPRLARDYIPAVIDTAAMPVRIERWEVGGKTVYRVIGVIWGGNAPTNALAIRFKPGQPWQPVDDCPMPKTTLTWSLWTHQWRPTDPGNYDIVLRVTDPAVRTRRLDLFYYVRKVTIASV